MPLSKEEMREYMKGYMQRKRAVKPVKPVVKPEKLLERAEGRDPRWVHLAEYIQQPCPGMPRLERMQRIAGSLGRYADQVYFGVETAISMEEVGKVIGILPPMITRA